MNTQSDDVSTRVSKITRAARAYASDMTEARRDLFQSFCRVVAPQLRASYVARHGAKKVPQELMSGFEMLVAECSTGVLQVRVEPRADGSAVVRTNMRDQPFIVDTVRLLIDSLGASIVDGFSAVVAVQRGPDGELKGMVGESGHHESIVQFDVDGFDPEDAEAIAATLRANLRLTTAMVKDFSGMTSAADAIAARFGRLAARRAEGAESYGEAGHFLRWLLSDNFVFMGMVGGEAPLGFDSPDVADVWQPAPALDEVDFNGSHIQVRKGTVESPVHRAGRVDEIRIRVPDEAGNTARVVLVHGMFTFRAVTQPSRSVPILRRVLSQILQDDYSRPGSWRYKGVANVFDSLPTEYLFTADLDETRLMIERVLDAEAERGVRILITQKPTTNVTFVLGAMPRAQFDDALRRRMEALLIGATGATYLDHGVLVGRFETVLVHFYLTGARPLSDQETDQIRLDLAAMATPWELRLYELLNQQHEDERAEALFGFYGDAFDQQYVQRQSAANAARDIEALEALGDDREVSCALFDDRKGRLCLRIYQSADIILSKSLPVLTNFGLVVSDQYSNAVMPSRGSAYDLDTFRLKGAWGLLPADIRERGPLLCEAVEAVFQGQAEDDELNRLVLRSSLDWRRVDLLRAVRGHLFQLGLSRARVTDVFLRHPTACAALVEYFVAKFDPCVADSSRKRAINKAADGVKEALRKVTDGREDYVLRCTFDLMRGMLRTNFFRDDRKRWYISFKVDHDLVDFIPEVGLKYEIYVHHPEMEGLHFRGGKVARGGLRWSDRIDYRTEVLGLVTTQMVKNVLIVPEGAKGGFRLKQTVEDRHVRRQKADELYRWFIRGLLDVTDNLVEGEVVNPPQVVHYDGGDDPYLVVAADKGTAHLSDTANSVAVDEYGFWLGDAFASGGSQGYDHKKVGITARGAWECVRRHFKEMGVDPEHDEFTTIGVGDTGGDVFGNGVIEFPKTRLLAAFNHLHVFLDPSPDTEVAFRERKRLFKAVKGWDHYDSDCISEGGGVFDRRAKSIKLSPEAKAMLGALKDELPPDAVIRLILRMNVDLLWSGGIGTYVKSSTETHVDAGDPGNDALRVNADELRCRVVGEGANLSFTSRARVEFGLSGGRINTDFVDNSGGVDMSDHEVNIKILLGGRVAAGEIDGAQRNKLIADLTKQVARDVLANNDTQSRQLSMDQVRSTRDPFRFARAIRWIEEQGSPDADGLGLPVNSELARRASGRRGLSRSELALLSSHVKMHVFKRLKEADPALVPGFEGLLSGYFPKKVRERWPDAVQGHMLATDIGMTVALTQAVADCGATFFPTLMDLTGRGPGEVLGAYYTVREAFKLDALRQRLNSADIPVSALYRAWIFVADGITGLCALWLSPGSEVPDAAGLERVQAALSRIGRSRGRDESARFRELVEGLQRKGVPKPLAEKCVSLTDLTLAAKIASLQARTGDSDRDAVVRTLAVGQASGLLNAVRALEARPAAGRWDATAIGILRTRYITLLDQLVVATPIGAELRLTTDRLSHKLVWGPMKEIHDGVTNIVREEPDVGAYLVAEERLRGLIARL